MTKHWLEKHCDLEHQRRRAIGTHRAAQGAGRSRGKTSLVSPATAKIQAVIHHEKGEKFVVDVPLSSADPKDYDALVLPGGFANPDELRTIPEAVEFVDHFTRIANQSPRSARARGSSSNPISHAATLLLHGFHRRLTFATLVVSGLIKRWYETAGLRPAATRTTCRLS
jgi:hypothetical protein